MTESGMVMTVLEAEVAEPDWPRLEGAYAERTRTLPPGLAQTFLVRDRERPTLWRITSVWDSQQALDRMRQSGETPGGVLIFRAAVAEPTLSIFAVRLHASQ